MKKKPLLLYAMVRETQKLIDMALVLGVIIHDLEVVIKIQNYYENELKSQENRMVENIKIEDVSYVTLSYLFLTLHKYFEFYEKYQKSINSVTTDNRLKDILTELKALNIKDYRNKFIGHIHDKKTKRPLALEEHQDFFHRIYLKYESIDAFWLSLSSDTLTGKVPLLEALKNLQYATQNKIDDLGAMTVKVQDWVNTRACKLNCVTTHF